MRVENFTIELVRAKEAGKTSGSFAEELFEAYAHSLLSDSAKDECRLSRQLLTLATSLEILVMIHGVGPLTQRVEP